VRKSLIWRCNNLEEYDKLDMKLLTVRTFDNPIDAHLVKAKLESESILCYLFDENIIRLNPLYNLTVGGIKLKVNEQDVEKASVVIQEFDKAKLMNDEGEPLKCPRCGSTDIYSNFKSIRDTKGLLSMLVALVLVVYPIYFKTVNRCKECGYEFK